MDFKKLKNEFDKRIAFIEATTPAPELPPLWEHQKKALENAKGLDYYALFFETGTGKSRTLIELLEQKCKEEKRLLKTVILCPLIVVENLHREFKKYGRTTKDKSIPLVGRNSDRLKKFLSENKDPKIFITNYEVLYDQAMVEAIKYWRPEALVADEVHRLKDPKAKRTKATLLISALCKYRFGLSGTPILNSQLDLFSQVQFLDRGETFGNNYFVFRMKYFEDKNAARRGTHTYFPNWQPKPGIDEEIKRKIAPFSMSVKKSECLDLPPLLKKEVIIPMSHEQERAYKQMKKDFIAFIKDKACVAELAVTKALRLQQIVSGYLATDDEMEVSFDKVPRLEALEKLLTEITPTNKVIVWMTFKKNYEMVERLLKDKDGNVIIPYATLTGDTLHPQKEIDKFQNDESVRVMIANPSAGGIGINLTAASYMVYYSRSFNLEHEIQSEARCYRGGSEIHRSITRVDLITPGTIDEVIGQVLAEKKKIGDSILSNRDVIRILRDRL